MLRRVSFAAASLAVAIITAASCGPASARWIDTKTGQPVAELPIVPGPGKYPFGHNHIVLSDPEDRNRAFDPETGRNFAREACPPRNANAPQPTPQVGLRSNIPSGVNLEGTLFAGVVNATSFGTGYDTNLFGGRGAVGWVLPGGTFRLQLDGEGVKTGDYSTAVGDRSYFAGGAHLNYLLTPNIDVGAFGGYQRATPTFFGPTSTNGFFGIEGRAFFNGFMVGGQLGRFDVSSGPGTLTDASFAEIRANASVSQALNYFLSTQSFGKNDLSIGGGFGYASGKLSTTALDASSTYWNVTLALPLTNTPLTAYVSYFGYRNNVQGLGIVWDERIVKGGIQLNLGRPDSPAKAIEPNQPLPMVLRTVTTF